MQSPILIASILFENPPVMKFLFMDGRHEISNNVVCPTSKASDQPAYAQSDQSLC